jgi:Cytochrome oxidase complex assembly protein 1
MTMDDFGSWVRWNWKWLLPLAGIFAAVIFGIFWLMLTSSMKTTFPYQEGLARARVSHNVASSLGSPLEEGFFASGSVDQTESVGNASIRIPITGPKGKGTIVIEAEKVLDIWNFTSLVVEVDETGSRIDLLKEKSY